MTPIAELRIAPLVPRIALRRMWRAFLGAAVFHAATLASSAEEIKPLFQNAVPGIAGKTFTTVEVDFAPGSKAPPHRHGDAFVYAYVLSGSVRSQLAGEPVRMFHAGQSWFEPPGARHLLTENSSRSMPARLLVVFVSDTGTPLKTPDEAKDPMTNLSSNASPDVAANPPASGAPPPQKMVDALYSAFGDHHSRAVHAKGIMAVGTFEPSATAAGLSVASIFSHGTPRSWSASPTSRGFPRFQTRWATQIRAV